MHIIDKSSNHIFDQALTMIRNITNMGFPSWFQNICSFITSNLNMLIYYRLDPFNSILEGGYAQGEDLID